MTFQIFWVSLSVRSIWMSLLVLLSWLNFWSSTWIRKGFWRCIIYNNAIKIVEAWFDLSSETSEAEIEVFEAPTLDSVSLAGLQWLSFESFQVQFYGAKLPFSERCNVIWKCHYAIELLGHSYHTLALSKEVYNFVFAQGAQKKLSHNRNVKCVLLRKYKHSKFEGW